MIVVFNKPYGVLSQFTPELGSSWSTLAEYHLPERVYPVGRLDADSEGMLVLTDEKSLVAPLLDPDLGHPRTYWVQVEHHVTDESIASLTTGVLVQGRPTKPCRAGVLTPVPSLPERVPPIRQRQTIPTSWIELELTEGRNRQVRRMTAAVGHPTLRLIRVQIGILSLFDLSIGSGQWLVLNDLQRRLLLERSH
jgi:23S rRNA pseudouridine2457 synthase